MTSLTLDNTHGGTTSGVACHHRLWTANTVDNVERGMPSTPRDSTHGRTTLCVSCYHCLSAAQTVRRCRAWHAITALGQHIRSNDVRRGMPSSPLGSTNGRTTSSVACHHNLWTSSHSQTASGVACHHRPWTANKDERRRAWHAIITFGQYKRSNDIGCGIPSTRLD